MLNRLLGLFPLVNVSTHRIGNEFHKCDEIELNMIDADLHPDSGEIKMAEVINRISDETAVTLLSLLMLDNIKW